jgi:hypothetical protein
MGKGSSSFPATLGQSILFIHAIRSAYRAAATAGSGDRRNIWNLLFLLREYVVDDVVFMQPLRDNHDRAVLVSFCRPLRRDREFESGFLQRRVNCEPDALAPHVIAGVGTLFSDQLNYQLFVRLTDMRGSSFIGFHLGQGKCENAATRAVDRCSRSDEQMFTDRHRRRIDGQGWTDALRALHPNERIYTFWKYFRNAFGRNAGLRIDHLLLSPPLARRLISAGVDP